MVQIFFFLNMVQIFAITVGLEANLMIALGLFYDDRTS